MSVPMPATVSEPTHDATAGRSWRDLVPWRPVLLAWAASRMLSVGVLLVLGSRTVPRPDITRLVMWDGGWYQLIATHGYGAPPVNGVWSVWPFFPLYPALVAALHRVG